MQTIEEQINEAIEAIKKLPKGVIRYNISESFDSAFGIELSGFSNEDLELYAKSRNLTYNIQANKPWVELEFDGNRFFARLEYNTNDRLRNGLDELMKDIKKIGADSDLIGRYSDYKNRRAVA